MLGALPCTSGICLAHAYIGYGIVGGFGLLFLWGIGAWALRRPDPSAWFWRLLALLQVVLVVQLAAGIALLATGHRLPSALHFLYGVVFPGMVLVGAHVVARGLERASDAWKVFAVAAFITFGLTLRALTTGLGLP